MYYSYGFFNYYNLFCKHDGVITGYVPLTLLQSFVHVGQIISLIGKEYFHRRAQVYISHITYIEFLCVCDLSATRAAAADGGVRLERGPPVYPGFPTGRERPIHPAAQSHRHKPHLRQQ